MSMYLQREDKKNTVIENHGYEKWESMIEHLNDPDKISQTNNKKDEKINPKNRIFLVREDK